MYAPPIIGIFGEQRSIALATHALQEQHSVAAVDVTRLLIIEACANFAVDMGFFAESLIETRCAAFSLCKSRDPKFARHVQLSTPVLLSTPHSAEQAFALWLEYRQPILPALIREAIAPYIECYIPILIVGLGLNKYNRNIIKALGGEILDITQGRDKKYFDSSGGTIITHHHDDDQQFLGDVLDFYQSIFTSKIKKMAGVG